MSVLTCPLLFLGSTRRFEKMIAEAETKDPFDDYTWMGCYQTRIGEVLTFYLDWQLESGEHRVFITSTDDKLVECAIDVSGTRDVVVKITLAQRLSQGIPSRTGESWLGKNPRSWTLEVM